MASIFRSFGSSNMSKRLLRYALSRLEFLDTDALDMDKLDLAWGKNSVLTFQDVGIKLEKLEALLQLPSSFKLQKAKVLQLRVTIPSAIYSSPIIIEIDGVQVKLKIASEEATKDETDQSRGRKATKTPEAGNDEIVPHAMDLAQSFLDTQPVTEKAELQAALEAETQDLAASVASSEDGSDEELPVGTGQPLSLPVFLADFLQGIVDRTQVTIKGVTFQLDVAVPVEVHSTTPELVTFQLAIDDIDVEGVTTQTRVARDHQTPMAVPKDGKRHIALNKIRAALITEANVFSTLSRTPSMPSSVRTNSPVAVGRKPLFQEPSQMADSVADLAGSGKMSQSRYSQPSIESEDVFNIPYDLGESNDDPEGEGLVRSNPSTPRALAPRETPIEAPFRPAQSFITSPPDPWFSLDRDARSEPSLGLLEGWNTNSSGIGHPAANAREAEVGEFEPSPSLDDDLARSQMFSHEEAESMYMSAFSQADESQLGQAMPGAWDIDPYAQRNSPNAVGYQEAEATGSRVVARANQDSNTSHEDEEQPAFAPFIQSKPLSTTESAPVDESESNLALSMDPENAAADDVATPRGPARLVKEILSLEKISLYIPSSHKDLPTSPTGLSTDFGDPATSSSTLDRSIAPHVPGAFSVHRSAHRDSPPSPIREEPPKTPPSEDKTFDSSIEVHLTPLDIRFDASISFLLAMVVSRILGVLKESSKPTQAAETPTKARQPMPEIKVTAEQISIQFLETLVGVVDSPGRMFGPSTTTFGAEALLTATLGNLNVAISSIESKTVTAIELQKFVFGYANDGIVSFDSRLQMRASVRDAFPSAGADVSLKIIQSPESTRCEVQTLPLHIKIDLQRLDDTFSWFGGLSSFLNMNSSMTSNTSPASKSPTRTVKKSRGVHFDAPIRVDDKSAVSDNKVNMRIGGFHLDLIGKECSFSINTSAVKLVAREEGVGVGITKIQLAGPCLRRSMGDAPIQATVMNTRLEYLTSPKDNDLERLLELIIPSKYKFDDNDDEIMVDTLLRQRRKGAVLRLNMDDVEVSVDQIPQLQCLPALGEELARLGTVAKYLPEDDRPGILSLVAIRKFDLAVDVDRRFGAVQVSLRDFEVGHISLPSLVALGVNTISVQRNKTEELVGSANFAPNNVNQGPALTMRMIPDAMEPVIKLRMRHLNFEYRVPTIVDILGLADDATPQDFEAQLAASVANLGEQAHTAITRKKPSTDADKGKSNSGKPTKVDFMLRDCLLGLNPLGLTSKLVVALTDAQIQVSLSSGDNASALAHINKASILLIDDISSLDSTSSYLTRRRNSNVSAEQVAALCARGYVDICYISSAKANIMVGSNKADESKFIDVEVRDDLLVLETCADSTQTIITLMNALQPPTPPSKEKKYQTEVVPVQDLLASISADAFGQAEGMYDFDDDFALAHELDGLDSQASSQSSPLDVNSQFYDDTAAAGDEPGGVGDSFMSERTTAHDTSDGVLLTNFSSQPSMIDEEDLVIHDNYFGSGSVIKGTAHRWNSAKNAYDESNDSSVRRSPLTVRVRDVHVIWNLFDGFDWDRTRQVITQAVEDVENRANERRARVDNPRVTADMEAMIEEEETVIGDFLFNSIYIGVPANRDPRELAQAINQQLNDNATETESIATTAMTATPSRIGAKRPKRKLRLNRSKRHKITFELKGINVDLVAFPDDSGETKSSVDVRIKDLDVFDHVPTSTWKKFATYDQDAGERELGTSMVHLEILNVKPVAELAASELVVKVTLLPLRLHVDQDALDFITRFFEFKDDSVPVHASPADVPFVQRAEINSIPVKLDFKPKRVDYAGLRSGHTTEFMNFLVLDEARMTMRHTIVYGVSGFDRLGKMLNDIWMPDIKRNQLPGILAGLAPVRSLVNVGSGFKDLIEIPIKEYQRDGKIVRSLGKGAAAFAKTTGTEIVKLGAKVAVGTQYMLQGAEGILAKPPDSSAREGNWEDDDFDAEETNQISLYADQPTGVVQGLRGAYSSLARDLNMARDAIIAVPGEVMESQNAQGVAKAVLKRAPTIIFRPLIGSSKAIGQTLMGATNALDPQNRRRIDEKYKKH
ncbi:ATG C terminal domain-containing protein [Apiospora arundinis]|uniref:Autophagy-related protein 2 n=1 Tax=Apiospora arundinis TaxID=335852 RepID=A0ABR2J9N7_9PEZI